MALEKKKEYKKASDIDRNLKRIVLGSNKKVNTSVLILKNSSSEILNSKLSGYFINVSATKILFSNSV